MQEADIEAAAADSTQAAAAGTAAAAAGIAAGTAAGTAAVGAGAPPADSSLGNLGKTVAAGSFAGTKTHCFR